MLSVIKESLKEWLVEHERLYWYIVVGLAVFAFGLITMFGLMKLERAEAATHETSITVPWGKTVATFELGEFDYYLVYIVNGYEYANVVLSTSPICIDSNGFIKLSGKYKCYTKIDKQEEPYLDQSGNNGITIGTRIGTYTIYRANHDIIKVDTQEIIYVSNPFIPAPLPEEYSGSAAYLQFNKHTWLNRFFMDENWDFNESFFKFNFDVANTLVEEYENRVVSFSGYITLPSKSQFDEMWNVINTSNGLLSAKERLEKYNHYYSGEYYPYWLKYLDRQTLDVGKKWYVTFTVDCPADTLEVNLTHDYMLSLIESCNGIDLEEYYDLTTRGELINIMKSYIWVSRLDSIVYTTYTDRVEYGNLVSFAFSSSLNNPVVVVGNSDPLLYGPPVDFVGPMLPDSDVQQNIDQAYQEALEAAKKENESLYGEMEGYYDVQGAFGDLSGSDLWTSFRSLADGLASMAPAVRAIATLSGAVLAFMPLQVTGIIAFTLLALCIIAIIKAIRG